MSVELNWETLTTGPDGEALALRIRDFIHTKFQAVQLPRFIKSVTVHDFEFGTIPPRLELKDITDPLPDFYEENEDYDEEEDGDEDEDEQPDEQDEVHIESIPGRRKHQPHQHHSSHQHPHLRDTVRTPSRLHAGLLSTGANTPLRGVLQGNDLTSPYLGVSTPGILGGASNLHYFQNHLAGPGWSGTQTPLAAVAGAHHHLGGGSWTDLAASSAVTSPRPSPLSNEEFFPSMPSPSPSPSHSRQASQSSISVGDFNPGLAPPQLLREKSSVSTLAPTSVNTSRPPTRDTASLAAAAAAAASAIAKDELGEGGGDDAAGGRGSRGSAKRNEPRPEDLQAVFRIRYAGDVRLRLTAEILLDYPMPSFVGIPVQLSVTGLTFDGVGVLANIRRRVHFCFLSPDDALAAVGVPVDNDEDEDDGGDAAAGEGSSSSSGKGRRFGGLLQEIRVESEIGLRDGGKQSLKNVGKVEKFVLEQVRRIFENEFVYPSFWTFLV